MPEKTPGVFVSDSGTTEVNPMSSSIPKLWVRFEECPPPGFNRADRYEVIRTVDAVDQHGNAVLNFLIADSDGIRLVFVPSGSVLVEGWNDYMDWIEALESRKRGQALLTVPEVARH
jgi:hypothetical protein